MREIELPAGTVPGSKEAVAAIESQLPTSSATEPAVFDDAPEPAAVVASVVGGSAYDLIIDGLEMMLYGFRELRDA